MQLTDFQFRRLERVLLDAVDGDRRPARRAVRNRIAAR